MVYIYNECMISKLTLWKNGRRLYIINMHNPRSTIIEYIHI